MSNKKLLVYSDMKTSRERNSFIIKLFFLVMLKVSAQLLRQSKSSPELSEVKPNLKDFLAEISSYTFSG